MSVKQERKMKTDQGKGQQIQNKKGKLSPDQGVKKKTDTTAKDKSVKANISTMKNDSNEAYSDKHKTLKDRKKFKRMKALNKAQNKSGNNKTEKSSKNGTDLNNVKSPESKDKGKLKRKSKKNKRKELGKGGGSANKDNVKSQPTSSSKTILNDSSASDTAHSGVIGKKKLKRLMWKQKQMAKKLARKGLVNKQEHKLTKTDVSDKVKLPKNAIEATANWRKLQETLASQGDKRKRKIPENRIRNPKYRKTETGAETGPSQTQDKDKTDGKSEIWFDDVDEMLLDRKPESLKQAVVTVSETGEIKEENPLVKPGAFKGVTKVVCMDCEMVGVGDGSENMLARVSIVNQYGEPIYDTFVKPKEDVVDYRTFVSGVRPQDLENAEEFEQVQKDVAAIFKGKTLVGHAIKNDLQVLYLSHPRKRIRDTSLFKPFRQLSGGRTPSLKKLSEKVLGVKVQEGEHNSIQDAQATMRLYTMYRKQWESDIISKRREKKGKKGKT